MSKMRLTWMSAVLALLCSCTHNPPREPASYKGQYNPEHTQLLKLAAENGLFFQIPESVIRDQPVKTIGDRCRKTEEGDWAEQIYDTLRVIQQNPSLGRKVHAIEFRRGDRPWAEISKDLDGAVQLVLSYSKTESRVRINSLSEIPCATGDMELVGKEMTVTNYEWPTASAIASVLSGVPHRPVVERYNVDKSFMVWLAERMTIFRLTPELAFEKTHTGESLLPVFFAQMSKEIQPGHPAVEFWLHEISQRSRIGQSIMFMGLKKDLYGSIGIQVDSAGKFARKMNGFIDPSYPYLSYKVENNTFAITSLQSLDRCMSGLMSTYRSPMSLMGSFETDPDSFLFPGHHCP